LLSRMHFWHSTRTMKDLDGAVSQADLQKKADRAKLIIYVLMFLFAALPFVAVWLSGALRF
jgi:hypothetical protein